MRIHELFSEPLLDMSMTRAAAIVDLRGIAKPLNIHLILFFGYEASDETRTHWKSEIFNWLDDAASIKMKPKNTRFSENSYYNYLFAERFGPHDVANITAIHQRIKRDKPGLGSPIKEDELIWNDLNIFHRTFAKCASQNTDYDNII